MQKQNIQAKCPVCGNLILVDKVGNGSKCLNCSWIKSSLNEEFPDRVICPNLISLNKAKALYIEKKPFIPDFNDFISGLNFYGEMQFSYQGKTYGVTRGKNDIVDLFLVNTEKCNTFKSVNEFKEKAQIDNKLLKDIWNDTTNRDWLQ
ncbi:MAG: hypothetical protein HFI85_00935 [Clostridia bacterium]|jgi:hypothetical protein|nr:hypothetical protein [Clostridia bacterium]